MRLVVRTLLTVTGGLALGLVGAVLLSPSLRSCARNAIRGRVGPDPDADEDSRPNIVLRAPGGEPAPLARAVDEGVAAASRVQAGSREF